MILTLVTQTNIKSIPHNNTGVICVPHPKVESSKQHFHNGCPSGLVSVVLVQPAATSLQRGGVADAKTGVAGKPVGCC